MTAEVSVKFTAEDAELWKALQRAIGNSQKLGDSIEGAGKKGRAASAEMERLAKKLVDLNSTPAERYERTVERMRQVIGQAGFTQDHFNRAVEREKLVLDKATAAAAAQSPELAKASEETRRFVERTKELNTTPLERYEQTIERLKTAIGTAGFTQEDFNRAAEREKLVLDKATAATDSAAREMDEFVASVKKLQTRPIEEYEKQVQKLREAHAKGKLTQKEFAAGMQDASAKYAAARREISASTTASSGFQLTQGKVIGMAAGLVSVATVWKGIREAIELANTSITKHTELAKGAKGYQVTLAAAQQEALKNLTGLSTEEKKEVLSTDVAKVTAASGLSDQAAITAALGAVYSAVGDRDLALAATETAAQQVPATPQKLEGIALGIAGIAEALKTKDTEAVEGGLLQAGGINMISDTEALVQNLAPAIVAGVSQLPKQDPNEVFKEVGAAFGVLAGGAFDPKGKMTGTAIVTLEGKMHTFFKTHAKDLAAAEETQRKHKSKLTDKEKETLAVGKLEDPGTFRKRIEKFQTNEKAREALLGDEGFGEQRFRDVITQLLTAGTVMAQRFEDNIPKVNLDAATARQTAEEIRTGTPGLELMIEVNKQKAIQQRLQSRPEMGVAGFALEDVQTTLDMTKPAGLIDSTLAELENWMGYKVAQAAAVNDPKQAFNVQYNRLGMRQFSLMQGELGEDAATALLKRNPNGLGEEQIDKLPMAEGERAKLKAVEDAKMRMNIYRQQHPEIFKAPDIKRVPGPNDSGMLPAEVQREVPRQPSLLRHDYSKGVNDDSGFSMVPGQPRPNDLGSVSQETRQVNQTLLDAATALLAVVDKLKQPSASQQVALRTPQSIPNYSGRARREQAQAVG